IVFRREKSFVMKCAVFAIFAAALSGQAQIVPAAIELPVLHIESDDKLLSEALAAPWLTIPAGKPVFLALQSRVSSKSATLNQEIQMKVVWDVVVDGVVVIPKGTVTTGRVTELRHRQK